jgi:hypothetical protein
MCTPKYNNTSSTRLRLERTEGHFILATQKAKSWKFLYIPFLLPSPGGEV